LRYLKIAKLAVIAAAASSLLFLTACGDGLEDKTVSIAISPTKENVVLGGSVELTVTAKNTAIKWPDQGAVEGSFTVNGNKANYMPPSVIGTYKFKVAAEADASRTVTATIAVVYAAPEITVSPTTATLKIGKTAKFTAIPTIPFGQPQQQEPAWEVSAGCGTIDQSGLFSASRSGDCTVTVSVRDRNNKKITASATVKIQDPTLDDIIEDMVQVRGGTFTMGCTSEQENDCTGLERPAHQVTLSDFYIGSYEVNQFLWKQIMGVNYNPSHNQDNNLPVESVSWDDVHTFIERLNERTGKSYRLPTEAEWEYAARGGNNQGGGYIYSGSNTLDDVGWYADNSDGKTKPVGTKRPNALGLYDMSGNVDEWVSDRYGAYSDGALNNPTGPESGFSRIVRGGSSRLGAESARVSSRGGWSAGSSNAFLGFRLAITSTR